MRIILIVLLLVTAGCSTAPQKEKPSEIKIQKEPG